MAKFTSYNPQLLAKAESGEPHNKKPTRSVSTRAARQTISHCQAQEATNFLAKLIRKKLLPCKPLPNTQTEHH